MTNRYQRIEAYSDLGLGTDGPEVRRFTRVTDKNAPADGQVDEGNNTEVQENN